MKALYILPILFAAAFSAAGQAPADTLASNVKVDSVMVIHTDAGVKISLFGVGGNPDKNISYTQPLEKNRVTKTYQKGNRGSDLYDDCKEAYNMVRHSSRGHHWDAIIGGIGFGFNTALGKPAAMETQMTKSWDIQWLYMLGARYRFGNTSNSINFGLGLDWRNYKSTIGARMVRLDDRVSTDAYPEGVEPAFSRIKIFSLTVPVLYKQSLPWHFPHNGKMWLALGAVVNFNTHSSVKTGWTAADGRDVEQSHDHAFQRRITCDGLAIVGLNSWLGVYVRYTPMKQLREPSLQFSSLTTGLTLAF